MQRKSVRVGFLFSAAGFGLALLAAGVGCPSKPVATLPLASGHRGVTVQVACPGDVPEVVVKRYGASWASQTGARVEVVRYDPATGPQAVPAADLWVVAPAEMPRWAAAGALRPLPEEYTARHGSYGWENLLAVYRDKLLVWDNKVYALPLLGEELLCFYRADLFAEARHRRAYKEKYGRELAEPATWEEFADLAAYFHQQHRPGLVPGAPSLPPLPEDSNDLDHLFYTVAVPFVHQAVRDGDPKRLSDVETFSCHYDYETGEVRIATPGFVHTLELLKRLQAYRPPQAVREPPRSFQEGHAVLCLASPAWISRFQSSPAVEGKFGFCRVPGSRRLFAYGTGAEQVLSSVNRVAYLGAGGWLAVVPQSAAHPQAAFALLAELSSPKTSCDIVIEPAWGGGVFRREQFQNRGGWLAFGLNPTLTETLVETIRQTAADSHIINPVLRLRIPDERTHVQALVEEVRAALAGSKEPTQALAAAAARWRELDQRKELKVRLADYRLSIGLRPKS